MAEFIYAGDGGAFKSCSRCGRALPLCSFRSCYVCRDCVNQGRRDDRAHRSGYVDGARWISCARCSKQIKAASSAQKYCGPCAKDVIASKSEKIGTKHRQCVCCGAIFEPGSNAAKYCSLACRGASESYKRRRQIVESGGPSIGSPFHCASCGVADVRTSPATKFCSECRASARKNGQLDWRLRNPEKIKAAKARRRAVPRNNLDGRMGCAIWQCLRERKAGWRWEKLVGYTVIDLMSWLEKMFTPGMGWHNIGEWHIDHIIPKSSFVYQHPEDEEFKACWALTNLRPLWAIDNLKKSNRRTLLI